MVLAGLPGVGKSTLARMVAESSGAVWLRVDTVEAGLVEAGIPRAFETGLAAYLVARNIAAEQLRLGRDVVIDAVNGVLEARRLWRSLSEECGATRFVIEVVCPDPREHRRRVESRADPTPPLPAPSWAEVVRREYRPWTEPILTVDGTNPPSLNLRRIMDYCAPKRPRRRKRAP